MYKNECKLNSHKWNTFASTTQTMKQNITCPPPKPVCPLLIKTNMLIFVIIFSLGFCIVLTTFCDISKQYGFVFSFQNLMWMESYHVCSLVTCVFHSILCLWNSFVQMCIVGIYPSDYCSIPLCDNDRIYPFYRPWVGGRSGCLHFTANLILAPVDWYPCAEVSLGGYLSCNNVCGSLTTHMCILKFHRNGKLFFKVVAPIHRFIIGG